MPEFEYPVRCVIVDPKGTYIGPHERRAPAVSLPHIGKAGLAEVVDGNVRITLDDGSMLWGYECWWAPRDA